MQLKTIEIDGKVLAEVQDGKPVYVYDDGNVSPFDAAHAVSAIKARNAEAKSLREAKEALESRFKTFDGLDPEKARKAIETFEALDAKKLIDAGEVEKVRNEAKIGYERKIEELYRPLEAERNQLKAQLYGERLSTHFSRSKYIAEKVETPLDLIQARFGPNFTFDESGKIVAKSLDGSPLYSRANPSEPPDFEEAIEMLINAHPDRDRMLKGTGAAGGGAGGYKGGGGRQITRAQLAALDPAAKMATAAAAKEGKIEIVD